MKLLPPGTSQRKIAEKLCVPKSTVAKLLNEWTKKKTMTDPSVTAREDKKRVKLLKKFFMQEGNGNSLSDKLEACDYFVNQN